jgi:hypothetical protein
VSSWTYKSGTNVGGEEICWPRDLLSEDLPAARVLAFSYDSDVPSSRYLMQRTLYHHARRLLMSLKDERTLVSAERRPLIFIGHSLGGLIVKSALIFSNEAQEPSLKSIGISTCGVIFFGTPHQGSANSTWGEVLKCVIALSVTNEKLISSLEEESKELEFLLQRYKALEGQFITHYFYEGKATFIGARRIIVNTHHHLSIRS